MKDKAKKLLYNLATDKYHGFFSGIAQYFLWLCSLLYGTAVNYLMHKERANQYHLKCKAISAGNITLGGTGKTSMVEYLARKVKERGFKPVILSRGYKKRKVDYSMHLMNYDKMGDEPYMLASKLAEVPVLVGKDRIILGRRAIKEYAADTVILDDGMQQWGLKKDLEIIMVDSGREFGNRYILPRGILREPLDSLKYADIFVLAKANIYPPKKELKDFLGQLNPKALMVESGHFPSNFYKIDQPEIKLDLDAFKGKRVALVSGIGDPHSFEKLSESLGITAGLVFEFPDHHHYLYKDLYQIGVELVRNKIDTIITTEKDAVRLKEVGLTGFDFTIYVLAIELKITQNEEEFLSRLYSLYNA